MILHSLPPSPLFPPFPRTHTGSFPHPSSLFSYLSSLQKKKRQLTQTQTGLSLTLIISETPQTLTFSLTPLMNRQNLFEESIHLGDAGIIDFVLHIFDTGLRLAQEREKSLVLFHSQEKPCPLSPFGGWFSNTFTLANGENSGSSCFGLKCTEKNLQELTGHIGDVRHQIHQKLWRLQKEDPVVRTFLRGESSIFSKK